MTVYNYHPYTTSSTNAHNLELHFGSNYVKIGRTKRERYLDDICNNVAIVTFRHVTEKQTFHIYFEYALERIHDEVKFY